MADDARTELREMIQQIGELARATDPPTELTEIWADPRLWTAMDGKEWDDIWLTMFMLGMMGRDIEVNASGAAPARDLVGEVRRRLVGNEVPDGTIASDKRSSPMTAGEIAVAHGVEHTNPSKWLKDSGYQFERCGKKFVVDKTLFQTRNQG
ncbi:hypothetical protein [Lacipirellula sp.]|uniref:hypothetical protein n=1 Tax=Lacipirellula sp. TaxID=2691419 RepID=UPI003D11C652